ncbi:MAG TPA: pseudaminic acid cytidylyltransferase [Sulfitobacter sp.]|nr:pseudaminic acid cytidylyltransferase [Sulfitobacter sp.]
MITAIIPARGGSKRIKNKNIIPIGGHPLIAWTIQTALASNMFDKVIVSTDCPDIAEVAKRAHAHVPPLRPPNLSDDHTTLDVVMQHVIETHEIASEWVCLLYATACLLEPQTLSDAAALALSADPQTDFVMGVVPYPHPIQRAFTLAQSKVCLVQSAHAKTRTQDLEEHYHDAGQFVFGRRAAWQNGQSVWDSQTLGTPVARHAAVDIDTPDDLVLVEALMRSRSDVLHA